MALRILATGDLPRCRHVRRPRSGNLHARGDAGVQKPVPDSNFKSLRPLKRRMGASNWPWMRPSVKSVQSAAKKVLIST